MIQKDLDELQNKIKAEFDKISVCVENFYLDGDKTPIHNLKDDYKKTIIAYRNIKRKSWEQRLLLKQLEKDYREFCEFLKNTVIFPMNWVISLRYAEIRLSEDINGKDIKNEE